MDLEKLKAGIEKLRVEQERILAELKGETEHVEPSQEAVTVPGEVTTKPEIPVYVPPGPRGPRDTTRHWDEEKKAYVMKDEPAAKPLVGQEMAFTCSTHGRYVGTWSVLAARKPGDLARAEGPSRCPLCKVEEDRQNQREAERWKDHLPAEQKPRSRSVNSYEPGQNVDPHHDSLPPFDHSCGVYRR